ncbi:dTDP-4-dehydrorhamnose 3,5-epimerase [Vibrio campbellii]|uniref:dTDP-4-dehydrorhamnose 3,5-epimerase n=1 Tax=Vibrio campbellii TaxID=680 RepID=UPI001F07C31E|nr:dTDP-4-dehydrorhamnose 3,5-epimerase [Vibrio campbellii]UMM02859.1 dTDP-4-dehydrorhamnose 3,5-epimerase [Vibrio campbellii]
MEVIKTRLKDCIIIKPKVFEDARGYFMESYNFQRYSREANLNVEFVQDNRSASVKNVLRGLHFQVKKPQGKLVSVTKGEVFDVAVDLRTDSDTFGCYESVILNEENKLQFYIPAGFAHGFVVLSETAEFQYKCTDYYDPADESGIIWNDSKLDINWPVDNPILSDKDLKLESFDTISIKLAREGN